MHFRTEKLVKIPLQGRGDIVVTHREVAPGVFVCNPLTSIVDNEALVSVKNISDKPCTLNEIKLSWERPPTQFTCNLVRNSTDRQQNSIIQEKRHTILDSQLRLEHIPDVEGKESVRRICHEYVEIFHLPGDALTATMAATHHIPTPDIIPEKAIHLKSYRIPEIHKQEVEKQVKEMLDQGTVVPS